MPKCVFSALVLTMALPSIAVAQSAQSIGGDAMRLVRRDLAEALRA